MQVERAKILMAEKRYEAGIQAYQDLLKSEPKNAVFMNMIGIAYLNLSNYEQAKKYFERAAKADKKYSSAVNNLGMVYYTRKISAARSGNIKERWPSIPGQAGTHANLGFAYYNSNKFPEAAIEFQKALEIDPHVLERNERVGTMMQDRSVSNHGLFFFTMARVYAQKKDAEHCAEYLRKSFDEGYKDVVKVKTDPAFKDVINDPGVQAVLVLIFPTDQKATTAPGPARSSVARRRRRSPRRKALSWSTRRENFRIASFSRGNCNARSRAGDLERRPVCLSAPRTSATVRAEVFHVPLPQTPLGHPLNRCHALRQPLLQYVHDAPAIFPDWACHDVCAPFVPGAACFSGHVPRNPTTPEGLRASASNAGTVLCISISKTKAAWPISIGSARVWQS